MVLMVRSFRSTMNLITWLTFSVIILLSMFAIYCVESKPSFPKDMTLYQQKRNLIFENQKDTSNKNTAASAASEASAPPSPRNLIPTNLVLVSTLDGSIRGIDRFQGNIHWTLKGGPGSSLIKSNTNFETHKLYKPGPTSEVESSSSSDEEDNSHLFFDTLEDILSGTGDSDDLSNDPKFHDLQQKWENAEEELSNIYYIVEPQDGGTLYIYGDGRPLEVSFLMITWPVFVLILYGRNYLSRLKKSSIIHLSEHRTALSIWEERTH
jgi:hypothetical protein